MDANKNITTNILDLIIDFDRADLLPYQNWPAPKLINLNSRGTLNLTELYPHIISCI